MRKRRRLPNDDAMQFGQREPIVIQCTPSFCERFEDWVTDVVAFFRRVMGWRS